jgi:hypothetical protein
LQKGKKLYKGQNNSIFFRDILMKDKSEGHINAKKENPGSGYLPNKSKFIDHASKFSITSLKPYDTFEVIMDLISKIFDSDSCSLLLPNPNTNRLDFVSAYGIKAEELGSSKVPSSKKYASGFLLTISRSFPQTMAIKSHLRICSDQSPIMKPTMWL